MSNYEARAAAILDAHNRAASYGAHQTNPLDEETLRIRDLIDHKKPVSFSDPKLARILRLRLLTDRYFPYYDVSYCYGQMRDGTYVFVNLPWSQIPKRGGLNANIVKMAQEAKRYAVGLGLFEPTVISLMS